jgi:hypothetical protein
MYKRTYKQERVNMYNKKFASKEERLANLHIIVNHLANEVKYRPEIKNTLVHYIHLRDQVSMELEIMYCDRFNKENKTQNVKNILDILE